MINPNEYLDQVKLTPAQMKSYYETHLKSFYAPSRVKLSYLRLSTPDLARKIKVTSTQLKSYYEQNLSNFRGPASKKLLELTLTGSNDVLNMKLGKSIQQQLINADHLDSIRAHLPKGIRLDSSSVVVSSASDKFAREVSANLNKIGQISKPYRQGDQFEIFKFSEIIPGSPKTFDKVKASILTILKNQKAEQEYAELGSKLDNLTFENPETLEIAAAKLNLSIEKYAFFDWLRLPHLGQSSQFLDLVFLQFW